ncbi:endonuclease domain-containing protein [Streptomyces sp. NPDC004610]|uniref:endonuclease domain-containing protein n=1 Tax=unclassified Streptomyces TaxID=2593676 RepID=UPI0033A5CC53
MGSKHLSDEQRAAILRLLSEGVPQRAIAEQLNTSQSTISRIRQEPVNKTSRPVAPEGQRWCYGCQDFRPLGEFWKHGKSKDGLAAACKTCTRKARSSNRSSMRYRVATVYGITLEEYDDLRSKADKCAICGADGELHLDHNEATGALREFLCGRCNRGLGLFLHDPAALRAAANYLEKHGE